ncbi:MAG: hypothetical protein ACKPAH_00615, partial [Verrucomicrobiota bacterium]
DQTRSAARAGGMRTLAEDGWRLVAQGITTVEEVLGVTTDKESPRPAAGEAEDSSGEPGVPGDDTAPGSASRSTAVRP